MKIKSKITPRTHSEVILNIGLVKSFTNEKKNMNLSHKTSPKLIKSTPNKVKRTTFSIFSEDSPQPYSFRHQYPCLYNTFIGKLTIGELVLILQLITQARIPLFAMSFILTQIQTAESGSKEYLEILSLPSLENYHKKVDIKRIDKPTITFDHVNFNYDKSEKVLKDISFK